MVARLLQFLRMPLSEKDPGLEKTFVQMKLSVIPTRNDRRVHTPIALCANTQNKVSDADFYSNREFHRRIEQISRVLRAPPLAGRNMVHTGSMNELGEPTSMSKQSSLQLSGHCSATESA